MMRQLQKDAGAATLDALAEAPRFNQWMADTIRPYMQGRVLELGAGIGNLTKILAPDRDNRNSYLATDIDPVYLERLQALFPPGSSAVEVHRCDLTDARDFQRLEGQADTVICMNVLEHVRDDRAALAHIFAALRSGGRAILLVPQGPKLFGSLDVAVGHIRRYSEEELRSKIEEAGFQFEKLIPFNRISRPGWLWQGKVRKQTTLSARQMRRFDSLVWLWRRIDPLLPWRSLSLIAVAGKP